MVFVYVTWAIVFATIYHKVMEQPFVTLSKKIKWKERDAVIDEKEGSETFVPEPVVNYDLFGEGSGDPCNGHKQNKKAYGKRMCEIYSDAHP
jgi:hypothetical protein